VWIGANRAGEKATRAGRIIAVSVTSLSDDLVLRTFADGCCNVDNFVNRDILRKN